MSCDELQRELIAYHFGTITAEARRAVEEHLVSCPGCVRAFVTLKRDIETGEAAPPPSEAARLRLRRAVAQELGIGARRRWSWWERPLAFGLAGAAVVVALFVLSLIATSTGSMPRSLADGELPDRPAPTQVR